MDEPYDLIIIGYGAAALGAGLYGARYQLRTLILGYEFGGETATAAWIENYPGFGRIDGFELMQRMREQVVALSATLIEERANSAKKEKNGKCFLVETEKNSYRGQTVLLAMGRERRKLNLPREKEFIGKGVSYCAICDAPLFRNKIVAVVGGGDAAVKGALLAAQYARAVYLIFRNEQLARPEPINLKLLKEEKKIVLLPQTEVVELIGEKMLSEIRLNRSHNDRETLAVDGLLIEIGAEPRSAIPKELGVKLTANGEVEVDNQMQTNLPGVFAAGDLTNAFGGLKQTVTAVAQGVVAATSSYQYLRKHPQPCPYHGRVHPESY